MNEDPSPADAVPDDELNPDPEPEPGPDVPDDSGGLSITDILMETEPDENPAEYPENPDWFSHFVIAGKKMLNGITGGKVGRGTPAAQNLVMGGVGFMMAGESEPDEEEPEPESDGGHDSV